MDKYFMKMALNEAYKAYDKQEVPIGCVIVKNDKIIAKAYNLRESLKDPTAHAEILAIREASKKLNGWRLSGCTMYVTIEPCPMCAGAIVNSRIDRLVIGSRDKKGGGCGSVIDVLHNDRLNHKADIKWNILEKQSSEIMKKFFKELRRKNKDNK